MGTVNGARALGFAGRLGALVPGMKADAILVDLDRVLDDPWLTDELDIVEAFLHRAMGEDVATAVIGGRLVLEDRRFLTLDVAALYQEVRAAARTIGDEQRRRAEMLQRLKPYYQRWYNDWLGGETRPFYVLNSRV
jgi:5-methylthioadenosine/S-adenosylhomocysteine deaminase